MRPAKGRRRSSRSFSWPQAMSSSVLVVRAALFHACGERRNGAPGLFLEEIDQLVLPLRQFRFQRREGNFWFLVAGAFEAKHRLSGAHGGVIEQTLVNVADLLYAERTEGNAPALPPGRHRGLLCAAVARS